MSSSLTTVKCPKLWRFTVMEWNLIKAYMMDWNTKRYFEVGDTFVMCYVQPQVWQLLELFGDGSGCETRCCDINIKRYFHTPLCVGKLIEMSKGYFQRHLDYQRIYDKDINAWSHLMCKAYDATPEKNVYTYTMCDHCNYRPPTKREPPTSVITSEPSKGKVGGIPVWCSETRSEKVECEGNTTVSVTRPVIESNLTHMNTNTNKHVLNFCPLRQEYAGQGHLHTGAFRVEVLTHTKIHNDYLENSGSVTLKKSTILPVSCLKPWSEDMVITVEKVDYDLKIISLKLQKMKYLWMVDVSNDGEGKNTIQAIEYPDPSTKYPNGLVMTKRFNVSIIKTEECWRVDPDWQFYNYLFENKNVPNYGFDDLIANECIRKKGQKRPATRASWMN